MDLKLDLDLAEDGHGHGVVSKNLASPIPNPAPLLLYCPADRQVASNLALSGDESGLGHIQMTLEGGIRTGLADGRGFGHEGWDVSTEHTLRILVGNLDLDPDAHIGFGRSRMPTVAGRMGRWVLERGCTGALEPDVGRMGWFDRDVSPGRIESMTDVLLPVET